ncbi:MAG: LTA synthase family protein, partial [Bacteroidetes bacterium]|nr:LTA synthase family protein [Bacteroidota bacterium]
MCRLLFYGMNYSHFPDFDIWAFVAGIRFDLVAITYTNIIFILLSLIPSAVRGRRVYQSILKSTFFIFNGLALAVNCIDLVYFRFTLKRTTADIFKLQGIKQDVINLLPQFMMDFW